MSTGLQETGNLDIDRLRDRMYSDYFVYDRKEDATADASVMEMPFLPNNMRLQSARNKLKCVSSDLKQIRNYNDRQNTSHSRSTSSHVRYAAMSGCRLF